MENGAKPHPTNRFMPPKINISEMKLNIITCPATMFAKRRMINAAGFSNNTPANSTGTKITFTKNGMPGGQNKCPQKCLLVLAKIMIAEITPKTKVKAVLPVTLAEPGINPIKLLIKIKKKTVNK